MSLILPLIPKRALSRQVGRLAKLQRPRWLALWARNTFARHYRLNMSEAERPLSEYRNLDELFTRKLKAGVRPIEDGLVHPVDGCVTQMGLIHQGQLIQAKGRNYQLTEFLRDPKLSQIMEDGFYLTYYLCPTDYHRVHSAVSGEIHAVHHVPGQLWPVNDWSVNRVQNLFSVNERVIVSMQTEMGPVIAVLVGATNVGKIALSFDPKLATNVARMENEVMKRYSPPIPIAKGEELGVFHMGSSVVMLYSKEFVNKSPLASHVNSPQAFGLGQVKMGQSVLATR